jgi:DNA-3-methyladenine glycosylase
MRERRSTNKPMPDRLLCAGPARLVEALDIGQADNGAEATSEAHSLDDLLAEATAGPRLARIPEVAREAGIAPDAEIAAGPRIGIREATDLPWRLAYAGNPWLSKPISRRS